MDHVHKCASALRPLIESGETNGIPLAERAITEMLAATPPAEHKTSLNSVQSIVQADRAVASGSQLGFADTVNDYIEMLIMKLECDS